MELPALLVCVFVFVMSTVNARTLTEEDLDHNVVPQPGDEVILRDFSRLRPKSAMGTRSVPGKWWLRRYREKGGREGIMLMTVERNLEKPETCLVPAVTYPLSLNGWYEVWIATYRGLYGGGIDVRLTGDDCFVHIDPQQVAFHPGKPKPRVGAVVELKYKPAVDLTDQSLVFQQPHGAYESFHWGFCEASLAYVRLVRLSDEQVAAFHTSQASNDRRLIAYDDDNFSRFWQWGGEDAQAVLRIFEPFRYHDIAFFGLNLGATTSLYIPTPYTDPFVSPFGRLGDKRVTRTYKALVEKGIDMLTLSAERAHKYGFKLLPTLRMSAIYCRGPHYRALSKWRLKDKTHLNFARPEIRNYFVTLVRYILENYDVDGFILDFTRHCLHFNPDEPNKIGLMNKFCDDMRTMVNEVSAKKGRKLLLAASFTECDYVSGFHQHYLEVNVKPNERLAMQGIDVDAWVRNGYYDIIIPEGPNINRYIAMTRGTTTKCFPRWTFSCDINGRQIGHGAHDPTPSEDKKDRPIDPHVGPLDYEVGWLKLREEGADGLYIFNNAAGWITLRRMGHLDEVRKRVTTGQIYGLIEGPFIEFLK